MPPSDKVKRIVWVKSGGRCTICRDVLCVEGVSSSLFHFVGDVAHVVAEEQRNSVPNLLLLCKRHHKIVDDDPATYTVDILLQAKTSHDKWVASTLSSNCVWETKLFHLYYINVPRLSLLSSMHGATLDLTEFEPIKALHELGWELNRLMAALKTCYRKYS